MQRWFNTAGPCQGDIHYMLPPIERLPELTPLIEQRGYFVIHAPRQTGKTTAMLTLAQQLTERGNYTAVMVSVEVGAPYPHNPDLAEAAILDEWRGLASTYLPPHLQPPTWPASAPGSRIGAALRLWAQTASPPLVIFIDEIDSLTEQTLISFLRQLRSGYPTRPRNFPQSIASISWIWVG